MYPSTFEDSCITRLLSSKHKNYIIGIRYLEGTFLNEDWIRSVSKSNDNELECFDYNLITKELKMSKRANMYSDFISEPIFNIQTNSVIDLSNNGMRFEGSSRNNSPFGYIRLINNLNEVVYQGVMINNKKECFGIDFYPGVSIVEYCGCYWNNERHGFGMLYDRKGNLMYEGDFIRGRIDYETNVMLKNIDNDRIVHSLIHELVIEEGCGNDYEGDVLLCGFDNLERVVVKKNSFRNVNSIKISDNCVLKIIDTDSDEWDIDSVFCCVKSIVIESMMIDD